MGSLAAACSAWKPWQWPISLPQHVPPVSFVQRYYAVSLISSAYAQTAPAAAPAGGDFMSSMTSMLPLVLMFVVLYFVMIRPQMKKQKEHRAMIEALAKGDEVVVAGGMLARITRLGEGYLTAEIANNVEIQIQRSAVIQVLPKGTMESRQQVTRA